MVSNQMGLNITLTWQLPRGRPINWWVDTMCLSGSCSGRVTEVNYGSKVVREFVGVGSGHDEREMVVYRLTGGVEFLLTQGLSQGGS